MQMLIRNGADPNLRGGEDVLPALHKAVDNNSREIVQILLDAGANPEMAGPRGFTAIEIAEQLGLGDLAIRLRKTARQRSEGNS